MNNSLRKLNRRELLEILVEQSKIIKGQDSELKKLKKEVEAKRIMINDSGSLAEAALKINQMFEVADNTAKQYLDNIEKCNNEAQKDYDKIIQKAHEKAKNITIENEKLNKDLTKKLALLDKKIQEQEEKTLDAERRIEVANKLIEANSKKKNRGITKSNKQRVAKKNGKK